MAICALAGALLQSCSARAPVAKPETLHPTPSVVVTTTPGGCLAPQLRPSYLPDGVRPSQQDAVIGVPDWWRTWASNRGWVQVVGGFHADHGEGDAMTSVKVRKQDAVYTRLSSPFKPKSYVVDWIEDTRCGPEQYAVGVSGFSIAEMLKVARSLKGDLGSSPTEPQ